MSDESNLPKEVPTATGAPVSVQVLQDVYHTLTGKTEHLGQLLFAPHSVTTMDIQNLHTMMEQAFEQYHCIDSNLSITVKYNNGKTERFSGIQRFVAQAGTKNCSTENIEIEYDFLILLPQTQEPKPYKLIVNLRSTVGVEERLRKLNASATERHVFYEMEKATARYDIHYVDLAVARNLEAQFEHWYDSLRKQRRSLLVSISRVTSKVVSPFARTLATVSAAYFSYVFFAVNVSDFHSLFKVGLSASVAVAVANIVITPLAVFARNALQEQRAHSVVILSEKDKELDAKVPNSMMRNLGKSIFSIGLAFLIGVAASYAAYKLGW